MHNINHYTYDVSTSTKKIEAELSAFVSAETYQEGGSLGGIRWIDSVCETRDSAETYIENHDNGWYDNLAVKYKELDKKSITEKENSKLKQLEEKQRQAYQSYNQLEDAFHFANVKSAFIGCKECGSKISSSHLRGNYCPVCRKDMRPQTTLDRIQNLYKKWQSDCKATNDYSDALTKKHSKIKWLVKIEYHT